MKSVFKKTKEGIFPIDEDSMSLFDKIPDDSLVFVEFIKKRNYGNHKRFIKLCEVTFAMQETQDNTEIWRKHVIMIAGYFDLVIVPMPKKLKMIIEYLKKYLGGDMAESIIEIIEESFGVQYWPRSMSFEKMDELEFREMFDRAINGFINRYGNGISEEELKKVIEFD